MSLRMRPPHVWYNAAISEYDRASQIFTLLGSVLRRFARLTEMQ